MDLEGYQLKASAYFGLHQTSNAISVLESDDYLSIDFKKLDKDQDGFITENDLKDWPKELADEWINYRDEDNDFKVSFEEFTRIRKQVIHDNWVKSKLEQLDLYEENSCKLPQWYQAWFMAKVPKDMYGKPISVKIDDIPPEYVYIATKVRAEMMRLLSNELYFCVAGDRNTISRQLKELLS